jgi:hypothetical protein
VNPIPPDRKPKPEPDPEPDPLDAFELPPDVMGATFEHAISDVESVAHERGHAVASALQRALKGSLVDYAYPGILTVHLASGAVARCGGPTLGWMVDLERTPGDVETFDVDVSDDETDTKLIAKALAKVLKRR